MTQAREEAGSAERLQAELAAHELIARMAWLVRLRWLATGGVAVAITAAHYGLGIRLPLGPLYAIAACLAAYNGVVWQAARRLRPEEPATGLRAFALANLQISVDLFLLAGLLYFSGGIGNPFSFYFVFHIVIASTLLSRRATYFQTGLASLFLLAMTAFRHGQVVPHFHLVSVARATWGDPLIAYGTCFVVVSTLFLTAYFATSITSRLRAREADTLALSQSLEEKAADLGRAVEELRRTERTKSEYMRRVAHELRSPLATIEQMVALVMEGHKGEVAPAMAQTLGRARARLRLLMEVSRDLLVLSRAREANLARQMQPVRLSEVIAALPDDLAERAKEAHVDLQVAVPENLPAVAGEPESLALLVSNLVSNAIKYNSEGGSVKVAARAAGRGVEISVADSGMGIPPEEQEKIFNDFYRAPAARESGREGTGLGLSIVKAIADAHGAALSVESQVGVGTTFRVLLPPASEADLARSVPHHLPAPEPKRGDPT